MNGQVIHLRNIAICRRQRWREAAWRLLSACFHNASDKQISDLADEYWAAVARTTQ